MNPKLLTTPFAQDGIKNNIPESNAPEVQNATYTTGFPDVTQRKISEGGIPPDRADFNGVLNEITQNVVHQNKGLGYEFDEEYANKIGGYPIHAELMLSNGRYVKAVEPSRTNNPNVDTSGWVYIDDASQIFDESGNSQQYINNSTGRVYKSISDLRTCKPRFDGEQVYLNGLTSGITDGSGYWYYDATDTTSADNGWFVVKTNNDKVLKRVGIDKYIKLSWAAIPVGGDLSVKWQDAIDYVDALIQVRQEMFTVPTITIQGGKYELLNGVRHPPYICTVFESTTYLAVNFDRSHSEHAIRFISANGTQYLYRDQTAGVQWNYSITSLVGKIKLNYTNPSVLPENRPSGIVSGNLNGADFAYQANMRVCNFEIEAFLYQHEIVARNSWGIRFENMKLVGRITDGTYGICTSSLINVDSGERLGYVNSFIGGVVLKTPGIDIVFESCSFDFIYGDVFRVESTAGYGIIQLENCHIEVFNGYVINSEITGTASNLQFFINGGHNLPNGQNILASHDRVLFNGNIGVWMDRIFIQADQYSSNDNLGQLVATNGTRLQFGKSFTAGGRPRVDLSMLLSTRNDFSADEIGAQITTTTPTVDFEAYSATPFQTITRSVELSPENSANKTLKLSTTAVNSYARIISRGFTPVVPLRRYVCRPIIEVTTEAATGKVRPFILFYDKDSNAIGSPVFPPYDITITQYINGAGVPFVDRQTKRIPIIHASIQAPRGAVFARQGMYLTETASAQDYYVHSVSMFDSTEN